MMPLIRKAGYTWKKSFLLPYESLWGIVEKFKYFNVMPTIARMDCVRWKSSTASYNKDYHCYCSCHFNAEKLENHFLIAKNAFNILENIDIYPEEYLIDRKLKYCPVCIKYGYHSLYHQLIFIEECPVHQVKLRHSMKLYEVRLEQNIGLEDLKKETDIMEAPEMISEYLCHGESLEYVVPRGNTEKKLYLFINGPSQEDGITLNNVLTAFIFSGDIPKESRSATVSYKKSEMLIDEIKKVGRSLDILHIEKHYDLLQYMSVETMIFLKERIKRLPEGIYNKTASDFLQSYISKIYGHVAEYNTEALSLVLTAMILFYLYQEHKDYVLTLNKAARSCQLNPQYYNLFWKPVYKRKEEFYLALTVYWHCMEDCHKQVKELLNTTAKEDLYIPNWSRKIKVDILPLTVYDKSVSFEILKI